MDMTRPMEAVEMKTLDISDGDTGILNSHSFLLYYNSTEVGSMTRTRPIGAAEMKTMDECYKLDHVCGTEVQQGDCCRDKRCHPETMCKLYHSFNKWYCRNDQGAIHLPGEPCCGQKGCHREYKKCKTDCTWSRGLN